MTATIRGLQTASNVEAFRDSALRNAQIETTQTFDASQRKPIRPPAAAIDLLL